MGEAQWTVAEAIRRVRSGSMRKLAAAAGLSAAQISRIEAGQVQQPAAETLVAIARGLWQNPMPLLILAGHIPDDEARAWLLSVLEPETEVYQDWYGHDQASVAAAREILTDSGSTREHVHRIAFDLFVGEPMTETEWNGALALLGVAGTDRAQRELITLFSQMTEARRERMLADARDQVTLSRIELTREAQASLEALSASAEPEA